MSRLEIRLLGETEVRRDGQPLVFPTKKVKELFAYLVTYHAHAHPRTALAGLLGGTLTKPKPSSICVKHFTSLYRLRQVGLLIEHEGQYQFYHEMFRQVVYEELSADPS